MIKTEGFFSMQGSCVFAILNLLTFKIATIKDHPPVLTSALSHNRTHHLHEILLPNIGIDGSAPTITTRVWDGPLTV